MQAAFMTAANAEPAEDLRWTSAAVLVALAARGFTSGKRFTNKELREWVPQLKVGRRFKHAVETLVDNAFITSERLPFIDAADMLVRYTVTKTGAEAVKAAAGGALRKSGPKGPHTKDRAVAPTTFAARLWALMRARQMLDTETAAATLVDAGDDVAKAAKTAQRYLARWASTGALTESKHRMPGGCKRYVLVKDSPTPPAWTSKAVARATRSNTKVK